MPKKRYASEKGERGKYARVYLVGRRSRYGKRSRAIKLTLSEESYGRLEQLAVWEGRLPTVMAETLLHLGFEVYGELMERVAGGVGVLTLPEGLPAVPSAEMLIEAVGRGVLAKAAAKKVAQRAAEIANEHRVELERRRVND